MWEGVGIVSYLLIGFWFTRIQAVNSALQAIVVNRVGDWALSIGLFALLWAMGDLSFSSVLALAPNLNESVTTIVCLCFLGAAMGKSSQLGLHASGREIPGIHFHSMLFAPMDSRVK